MKIGTKVIAYRMPCDDDAITKNDIVVELPVHVPEKQQPLNILVVHGGITVNPDNPAFEDVERCDGEGKEIMVRFPCHEHPRGKTCNCENNVRSMRMLEENAAPHLYKEDYYGGYYALVIMIPEK